jgi:EAL domain-containing protein (putative c-di-GMP-specific phosphodiesterase class I)
MLARNLGMEVTAEGVETLWQVRELQGLGCQFAQGYYFSKPLDARAAGVLLFKDTSWADLVGRDVPSVIPFRLEGLVS